MRKTAIGIGKGLDGREAARTAVQQAFSMLGTARPALAVAFIAQEYNFSEALAGLNSFLGNTPLWGFNTTVPMSLAMGVPTGLLPLLLAVEVIPDLFRTVGNVTADLTVTAVVTRSHPSRANLSNT